MTINNIKKGVYNSLLSVNLEDNTDILILSCLLYDYVSRVISTEQSLQSNVKKVVETYLPGFIKKLTEYKEGFVAYTTIKEYIENLRKNSFLEFTLLNINSVVKLFQDKTQIKDFSTSYYSQYMYRILNISQYHNSNLNRFHFSIMVPIIKYYIDGYKAVPSDMEVFNAIGVEDNPGKEILFKIKNIESSKVLNDIRSSRIPLSSPKDFFSISLYKNYIRIIAN
jgi:hypothetical protein